MIRAKELGLVDAEVLNKIQPLQQQIKENQEHLDESFKIADKARKIAFECSRAMLFFTGALHRFKNIMDPVTIPDVQTLANRYKAIEAEYFHSDNSVLARDYLKAIADADKSVNKSGSAGLFDTSLKGVSEELQEFISELLPKMKAVIAEIEPPAAPGCET